MSNKSTTPNEPKSLQNEIIDAVSEALDSTEVAAVIKTKVQETIVSAVDNMFKWGDAKKLIEKKLEDVMIPAIKSYDFSEYVSQLDIIMNELLHSPAVICNNKILSNFKIMMTPPDAKFVTLEQLFEQYCKFVAENIDTNGRDIDYENGVNYEPIDCVLESENIKSEYTRLSGNSENYVLSFHTEEDNATTEYNEPLNFDVTLYRWSWMPQSEYHISMLVDPRSVRHMSGFESFIYSLVMANITVNLMPDENIESGIRFDETVTPEKEPEPTYQ